MEISILFISVNSPQCCGFQGLTCKSKSKSNHPEGTHSVVWQQTWIYQTTAMCSGVWVGVAGDPLKHCLDQQVWAVSYLFRFPDTGFATDDQSLSYYKSFLFTFLSILSSGFHKHSILFFDHWHIVWGLRRSYFLILYSLFCMIVMDHALHSTCTSHAIHLLFISLVCITITVYIIVYTIQYLL